MATKKPTEDYQPIETETGDSSRLARAYVFQYVGGDARLPSIAFKPVSGGLLEAVGVAGGGACITISEQDSEGVEKVKFMRRYMARDDVRCRFREMPGKNESKE
jgi:hypothetical protein